MVRVHDQIADRQRGCFGNDVSGFFLRAPRPDQSVTQHILLADHQQLLGFKTMFEAEDTHRHAVTGQRQRFGVIGNRPRLFQTPFREQFGQPFARAGRPGRNDNPLLLAETGLDIADHRTKQISAIGKSLRCKVARAVPANLDRAGLITIIECGKDAVLTRAQQVMPFRLAEIHLLWRHRLVRRRPERLRFKSFDPRQVMLLDLFEAAFKRIATQLVKRDPCFTGIVKDRLKLIMEERQPVFHAGIALPLTHRLVERVIARRAAKQLDVALPEPLSCLLTQRALTDGHQDQLLDNLACALCIRIERLDGLERISKKIQTHR